MYQLCPVCKGKGYITNAIGVSSGTTCPTCKGKRIISELTGLPPQSDKVISDTHKKHPITDFNIDNKTAKDINNQFIENDKYKDKFTHPNVIDTLPDLDNITEHNILNTIKYINNTISEDDVYVIKSSSGMDMGSPVHREHPATPDMCYRYNIAVPCLNYTCLNRLHISYLNK